jgi:DNA-directed RNA polymerase subunit RPC12/RpoP
MPKLKNIAKGLKAAAVSLIQDDPGEEFVIAGKKLSCTHCGRRVFEKKRYNLTTDLRQGFGADGATVLICKTCNRIEWFNGEI